MLSKFFISQTKEKLKKEREEILARIHHHDIDMDGDETDEIQGNMIVEMQNQLHLREQQKLIQIADSLQRIEKNEYGLCEDCEEEISEKRLAFNPHFVTCIICAEARELERRQQGRF